MQRQRPPQQRRRTTEQEVQRVKQKQEPVKKKSVEFRITKKIIAMSVLALIAAFLIASLYNHYFPSG